MAEYFVMDLKTYIPIYTYLHAYIHILEKEMATHYNVLTWQVPRTEEPAWLQSHTHTYI